MSISTGVVLDEYIKKEISEYAGIAMPVRASFLNRVLVRRTLCSKLHPNPDDEFSSPSVGPSYRIISEYEKKYCDNLIRNVKYYEGIEPVIVEKISPDGYRILNGHHRWAAAVKQGFKIIPIEIINTVHDKEIEQLIVSSNHDKRVTFDLDEVLFYNPSFKGMEKNLPFPYNKIYKQRLRLGVPALLNSLNRSGYDIWVYSSKYYSMDYIRGLFRKYHVGLSGIVTGTDKRKNSKSMANVYAGKYKYTLHIDNDMVTMINNESKDFENVEIKGDSYWSKEVLDIIKEIEQNEG